jgi:hypothetical protein
VHSGTAPFSAGPYTCDVQLEIHQRHRCDGLGLGGACRRRGGQLEITVAGPFWPASRPSAAHLMWRWNNPRRTMSETIQEALR